jgi:protein phosphatase
MLASARTDVGIRRKENQDFIYATTEPIGSLDNLFILADGMGGEKAGDYASRYAVEHLVAFFREHYRHKDIHSILKEGIRKVNKELYRLSCEKEELSGMGSTLVIATVKDSVLYIANIGDSRLYLLRDELEQITKDHSYVEELVALGMIKRGSRDYQEKKNIITRAMGVSEYVDADLYALKLKKNDIFLMCSDGLSNMVDEFEMEYIIRSEESIDKAAEILVASANRNGGKDNISVILVKPQISEVSAAC